MVFDSLSLLFLIPIVVLGITSAVHATGYLHGEELKRAPMFWFLFLLTLAAMVAVALSDNMFVFILSWEFMGLASAGLVAFNDHSKEARRATWIYLLACHAGAVFLILAGVIAHYLNSEQLPIEQIHAWTLGGFILAMIGFGLKIGFPGLHVWLPEAHPAAPAPASAVMSGAMIPLGFYGLARFVFPLVHNEPYVGWTFLTLGVIGSLGGILFALPQVNLKKLLAFSSIENMGIVSLGLGLGFLALNTPDNNAETFRITAGIAFVGAALHIINHAFLKGGLFLGAGSILRMTGTLDLDKMGGLMKRMPKTGYFFAINSLGICGLPPLNGFIGEFFIYTAAFLLIKNGSQEIRLAAAVAMLALALTGGLAAAAFTKAVGAAFLGEPRSEAAAEAEETPRRMIFAQRILFIFSSLMVVGALIVVMAIAGEMNDVLVVDNLRGFFTGFQSRCIGIANFVSCASVGLVIIIVALALARRFLCRRGGEHAAVPTWDCGYHKPTARMAYTGTAFTQPLVDTFRSLLRTRTHLRNFKGFFPKSAAIATETDDPGISSLWRPLFTFFARVFQRSHAIQGGSLHRYILILIIAVAILLLTTLI